VALPDIHSEHDKPWHESYLAVENFILEVHPEIIIYLGDAMEMGCFCHWNKGKPRLMEGKRYVRDCQHMRERIEKLRPCCKRMIFMKGNHEAWLDRYVDEHPALEGKLDLGIDLGLNEMDIEIVEENAILTIGKINFIHGWFTNKYHAQATIQAIADNVFYGHTHDVQMAVPRMRPDQEPHIAMSIGCLCNRNPHYRRNQPNNWVNAFGIFEVRGDGSFTPYVPIIINGAFSYGGEIWKG